MGKNRFVKRREMVTAIPHRASDKTGYERIINCQPAGHRGIVIRQIRYWISIMLEMVRSSLPYVLIIRIRLSAGEDDAWTIIT